jgi:hypothetical protein
MTFDLVGLLRFVLRWLWATLTETRRWTLRHLAILAAFFVVVPLLELVIWLGLAIDGLFFRGYRRAAVEAPVFIVGNPRSGTTFLHRLLARDTERFTSMEMWQILFAPAISQRRFVSVIGALERALGRPVGRLIDAVERRWHELNVMHEVSLRQPEEDDYLLLHVWSALTTGLSCGLLEEARPYTYFDQELSPRRRRLIFRFYRRCVQRHLHDLARRRLSGGPQYLAKNPALSPKVGSVFETFPDAHVVCLVRNPLEVVPSYVSMMTFSWRAVGIRIPEGEVPAELREYILEMAGHWYRYPLSFADRMPAERIAIVRYDDLVSDPSGTVRDLYERFGFEIGAQFESVLEEQASRARRYRSRHDYDLASLGLSRERILEDFADVFERFDFDTAT